MPMNEDEFVMIKGEPHYVIPHFYPDGNSCKCYKCRYFVEDEKTKRPMMRTGECHSAAHQTERGCTHRVKGWDKTADIHGCKWWFPIDKQPGEQEDLKQ